MIITFERASKQAGWDGEPGQDRIMIRAYENDEGMSSGICLGELMIESEVFGIDDLTPLAIKITVFGDAVSIFASGRVVNGLQKIERSMSLDTVEAELADAGIDELIRLTEKGEPRIIDNRLRLSMDTLRRDGLALYCLGSALLGKPAAIGAVIGEASEDHAREVVARAREIASKLGYPVGTIVVDEIKKGGGHPIEFKRDITNEEKQAKKVPDFFKIPGPETDQ